jgi:5-methylcytosine-specific restriction protein B
VKIFGGAIVAIEGDKRLNPDNSGGRETQYFELLDPKTGLLTQYAFPDHLYILAAMNQADVSVEPLDVAFLRRWSPFALEPDASILRTYFRLSGSEKALPPSPGEASDVYEAAVQAWAKINERIALGRGPEFRIGHGAMMTSNADAPSDLNEAQRYIATTWRAIRAHIDEVFFGDIRGVAASLNALSGVTSHPYSLRETFFADEPRRELAGPREVQGNQIYNLLVAIVG